MASTNLLALHINFILGLANLMCSNTITGCTPAKQESGQSEPVVDWEGQKFFSSTVNQKYMNHSGKPDNFFQIRAWVHWLIIPCKLERSNMNRSSGNSSKLMRVPQNQLLWDLGIPEQSMNSQENVNANLEVGQGGVSK